ncbi:hypothetical protein [Gordonia sp. ABSL49_1]|uniref:hypothetical protein n=1 Tax=Gordonia sp. ABSL49_1 TaxID=2920941 RepID=UPI001F0CDED3|nr:hypothetical protein [Gordonia sp. ABSL49_1]MCH5645137.1 hypothetical protein [Gordonia sp. ABSL49_1]
MAATGKDHARVNLTIWGDDDWLDLTPPAQHLYLVLWSSPGLSYCGAGEWKPARIAQRANGWGLAAIERAAAELSSRLFLLIDTDTEEFLLRSWIKHDGLWKQPNMSVSMANARADLASRVLRGAVVWEVKKLHRECPDMSGWKRDALVDLLAQKAVDPATIPTFNPTTNPSPDPPVNPTPNPYGQVDVDPPVNPGPTPAPSPFSSLLLHGGYVSTEGNDARSAAPPPPNCPNHPEGTDRPCGACKTARLARENWDADQTRTEADHRKAIRQAINDCPLCDDIGWVNGVEPVRKCTHQETA